jgi:hypothetical protein
MRAAGPASLSAMRWVSAAPPVTLARCSIRHCRYSHGICSMSASGAAQRTGTCKTGARCPLAQHASALPSAAALAAAALTSHSLSLTPTHTHISPPAAAPDGFNFYCAAPARTDASVCPQGHDAIMVLVPCPLLPPTPERSGARGGDFGDGGGRGGAEWQEWETKSEEWVAAARKGVLQAFENVSKRSASVWKRARAYACSTLLTSGSPCSSLRKCAFLATAWAQAKW